MPGLAKASGHLAARVVSTFLLVRLVVDHERGSLVALVGRFALTWFRGKRYHSLRAFGALDGSGDRNCALNFLQDERVLSSDHVVTVCLQDSYS